MKLTIQTSADLPARRDLALAYRLSLVVAVFMAASSAAGILLGSFAGHYGDASGSALGEAGLLVPGLLGQDAFNLLVGVPLLLGSMWLARRGSLVGLLLWLGALFYALYWYVIYLIGAPFLLYVALVTLSTYTTIALVLSIDGEEVRRLLPACRRGSSGASSLSWPS